LKPSIFEHLSISHTGLDGELWTVDAITKVAQQNKQVRVVETQGEWMTTGDPENYFHAHMKYVIRYEDYGSKLKEWIA
jgi:UTP-glucose-1-phosphate uridylyltransferase